MLPHLAIAVASWYVAVVLLFVALILFGLRLPGWFLFLALVSRPLLDPVSNRALLPPLQERSGPLPNVALTATGTLAIAVLLVGVFLLLRTRGQAWETKTVRAYTVLLGLAGLSLVYSIGRITSLASIAALASVAALVVLADGVLREKKNARMLLWAVFLSSVVPLSLALYQVSQGGWERIGSRLVKGSFTNVNTFAYYLVALVGFSLALIPHFKKRAYRILTFCFLGVCGGLLVFTLTRGAWLAGVVCIVVYVCFAKSVKPMALLLVVVLLLGLAFWAPLRSRVKYGLVPGPRIKVWRYMVEVGAERPLLGHGFGTALDIAEQAPEPVPKLVPHNDFVRIFVELGLVGLAAFFYFLYSALREGYEMFRRAETREARSMAAAFLGLFAGYIVASCVDNQLMNISMLWPLWTVFALARAGTAESGAPQGTCAGG